MNRISKKCFALFMAILMAVAALTTVSAVEVNSGEKESLVSSGTAGDIVYCKNSAGWSNVYCYMWENASTNNNNGGWPGKAMEKISDDIYAYTIPENYDMIIFNNNQGTQTRDMTYPGNGYIYDNGAEEWDIYDTSDLQLKSFSTDIASPQYEGMSITLSAVAESVSAVSYKFTVTDTATNTETVLKDFSSANAVTWIPVTASVYKLNLYLKDESGNEKERHLDYTIKDSTQETKPIIKGILPNDQGKLLVNANNTISVKASGGNTGTKLLFYKYTVKDANGNIINTPYYTLNNTYSYKPASLGTYTLVVSVQASDNTVSNVTNTYYSVENIDETTTSPITSEPSSTATSPSSSQPASTGTSDIQGKKLGDVNGDGDINVKDATLIQKYKAKLITSEELDLTVADVNKDAVVNVKDATLIQKYAAKLVSW
ncbi:MAG: starch-binding protein [Acutalibacteraceae bacterium]